MENEQNQNQNPQKPSYEDLEQACIQMQNELNQRQRVNEIRDMIAVCLELLKYKDSLPGSTFKKVVDFLDRVIPVPKDDVK